jgi:hypothetical protein
MNSISTSPHRITPFAHHPRRPVDKITRVGIDAARSQRLLQVIENFWSACDRMIIGSRRAWSLSAGLNRG